MNEEKVLIVGIRKVSFTDNKTGNDVNGISLYHMRSNPMDQSLEGSMTGKDFVSNTIYQQMCDALGELTLLDKEVVFSYNRYGKVSGVIV